jgi:hypothetical protein
VVLTLITTEEPQLLKDVLFVVFIDSAELFKFLAEIERLFFF